MPVVPAWLMGVFTYVFGELLKLVKPSDVKKAVAELFVAIDSGVQMLDGKVTGQFKGIADEVAAEVHLVCSVVIAALTA